MAEPETDQLTLTFGGLMRSVRVQSGIRSQEEMGHLMGVSRRTITSWESGGPIHPRKVRLWAQTVARQGKFTFEQVCDFVGVDHDGAPLVVTIHERRRNQRRIQRRASSGWSLRYQELRAA